MSIDEYGERLGEDPGHDLDSLIATLPSVIGSLSTSEQKATAIARTLRSVENLAKQEFDIDVFVAKPSNDPHKRHRVPEGVSTVDHFNRLAGHMPVQKSVSIR